jgi:glycosyltransferase involved in cell wall biosynthesis
MARMMHKALLLSVYSLNLQSQLFSHQGRIAYDLAKQFEYTYVVVNRNFEPYESVETAFSKTFSFRTRPKLNFIISSWILIVRLSRKHRNSLVVFSFMTDYFSAVTSILTKFLGIKHVLWYAHAHKSFPFFISSFFVDRIISSTRDSLPSKSKKANLLGQMVDSQIFTYLANRDYKKSTVALYVGRVDESKGLDEIIIALHASGCFSGDFKLIVIGEPTPGNEHFYSRLNLLISEMHIEKHITFLGKQSPKEINELMHSSDFLVHNFKGSLDKVLVEAALTGLPIITTNLGFQREFLQVYKGTSLDNRLTFSDELRYFFQMKVEERTARVNNCYMTALLSHEYGSWFKKLLQELDG